MTKKLPQESFSAGTTPREHGVAVGMLRSAEPLRRVLDSLQVCDGAEAQEGGEYEGRQVGKRLLRAGRLPGNGHYPNAPDRDTRPERTRLSPMRAVRIAGWISSNLWIAALHTAGFKLCVSAVHPGRIGLQ